MPAPKTGSLKQRTGLWYLFWDSEAIPASAVSNLTLFSSPRSGSKSNAFTNMTASGNFGDQGFDIYSIAVQPGLSTLGIVGATGLADFVKVLQDSYLSFTVNQSIKFEAPLIAVGGGGGIMGASSTTAAATSLLTASNGVPSPANTFIFKKPISVQPTEIFNISVSWASAITVTTATRLWCFLYGMLYRRAAL